MRLLIVSCNMAPELIGLGKYTGEMAAWLAARGHQVTVVATPPYYPDWRVWPGWSAWRYSRTRADGVLVQRCPVYVPRRPRGPSRILHLASFALSSALPLLWLAARTRPDVVLATEPTLFAAPGALLAARLARATSWLHVQDLELDAAFALGLMKQGWTRASAVHLERRLLTAFDGVSAISGRMCERLAGKGARLQRITYFPNWVDTAAIHPIAGTSTLRHELGLADDQVAVLYAGNMAAKQGLEVLVDVAARLERRPDVVLVIAGAGPARHGLEAALAGRANVRFLPLQPPERLNALLNLADIHVLPQRRAASDLVMPSKLINMLASGRPVVAGASPGSELANTVARCGVVVEPENATAFTDAIVDLATRPDRRRALGAAARRLAITEWERDQVLSRFVAALEKARQPRRNC